MDQAVKSGRYRSRAAILRAAKLSSGYMGEFRDRLKRNPKAGLTTPVVKKLAVALGVSEREVLGVDDSEPEVVDIYPERAWAIEAARKLKFPEAAIQLVLKERPSRDPGRMYWFRRIEAESERVIPAADSGSFKL